MRRRASPLPQPLAARPPNGRADFCSSTNSDFRVSGNRASAAREFTALASTSASRDAYAAVCAFRVGNLRRKRLELRALAQLRIARFQRVVVISHGLRIFGRNRGFTNVGLLTFRMASEERCDAASSDVDKRREAARGSAQRRGRAARPEARDVPTDVQRGPSEEITMRRGAQQLCNGRSGEPAFASTIVLYVAK